MSEVIGLLFAILIATVMIPKLASCIDVVRSGVQEARILDGREPKLLRQALTKGGLGTTIVA